MTVKSVSHERCNEQDVEYPMSVNYCKSWTVVEALRELIANAKDEGNPEIYWKGDKAHIVDKGKGILMEHLLMGEGEEKSDVQIGQFKEGLKIAGLVLAREQRAFSCTTVDFSFTFFIRPSSIFSCDVLTVRIRPNKWKSGTHFRVSCTLEEFESAIGLFLDLPSLEGLMFSDKPGQLYINGVFVQSIESLYGYNLMIKEAANRDRSVLDMNIVRCEVAAIWNTKAVVVDIIALLTSTTQSFEHSINHSPALAVRSAWCSAITQLYGNKYCLTDTRAHVAHERGYTIISPLTFDVEWALKKIGVKTATEALQEREELDLTNIFASLTPEQQGCVTKAKMITELLLNINLTLHVVVSLSLINDVTESTYDSSDGIIRITPSTIDKGLNFLVGAVLHEGLHADTGASDYSNTFEVAMTNLLGRVAVKIFS